MCRTLSTVIVIVICGKKEGIDRLGWSNGLTFGVITIVVIVILFYHAVMTIMITDVKQGCFRIKRSNEGVSSRTLCEKRELIISVKHSAIQLMRVDIRPVSIFHTALGPCATLLSRSRVPLVVAATPRTRL